MTKWLIIVVLTFFMAGPARAEDVLADLSVHEVDITTNFTGAKLLIFGVAKKQTDVAVVIEGPPVIAKLWAKKRKIGLWINDLPITFDKVPGFYAIVSSKPAEETSGDYGLSLKDFANLLHVSNPIHTFEDYEALMEAQKDHGRYLEQTSGIHISKGGLFRADIELPASVPIGEYKVSTYLLKDGKVLTSHTTPLSVTHVGLEARINHLARERPFVYALLALMSSLALGGGAAYLFRRLS